MLVRTQHASRFRRLIDSAGLTPVAFVVWRAGREWTPSLWLRNRRHCRAHEHSTPIPPSNLIFSSTGTRDVDWFLNSGHATADTLREALSSIGRPLESFERVFELGCGCGRLLRQWIDVDGPEFYACDCNPRVIEWGRTHFGHVTFAQNNLEPPLRFLAGRGGLDFDLCYAVSVFTHLPERMQIPWLEELHRILRPDGILLVTLSGEGDLVRTTPDEQERFSEGQLVVVDGQCAGTNLCGVYHPEAYVRKNWSRFFEILRFIPQGAKGTPRQDLYVLRRV